MDSSWKVLGILISIDDKGFRCEPAPRKVKKWLFDIDVVLSECRLLPGAASKMAGRLSWGSSHMFRKVGRAMLKAIFDQKTRKDGHLSIELEESLRWWKVVFQCGIAEIKEWEPPHGEVLHMFCDARGSPARLGAVLFFGEQRLFTQMEATEQAVSFFKTRCDSQIQGLELLAISMGLSTFQSFLKNRSVVIHCDNTGAEVSFTS